MQREQTEVTRLIKALSYLLKHLDPDGIEVACMSNPGSFRRLKTATDIQIFINKGFYSGHDANCAIENALDVVLKIVRAKYLEVPQESQLSRVGTIPDSRSRTFRAISILVFTNGKWDDSEIGTCGAERPIRGLMDEMILQGAARTQVCLQFVRFGDSPVGKRRLQFLDDELGKISPEQK